MSKEPEVIILKSKVPEIFYDKALDKIVYVCYVKRGDTKGLLPESLQDRWSESSVWMGGLHVELAKDELYFINTYGAEDLFPLRHSKSVWDTSDLVYLGRL
jgi:hypothetical protein